jgi:transglutaminase-like putative cysteine protease
VTAGVATAGRTRLRDARGIRFAPAEGWLTLLGAATIVLMFAASLIEAGWLPQSAGDTRFLLQVALVGLAFGVFGAKIGWGRWRTHFVGALFAGLILPLIVGGLVIGGDVGWDPQSLAERMAAMHRVVQTIWQELAIEGRSFTSQYAHYHLVFGVLVWGAGMLAGFTIFGHRRPLDAVVVVGLAILANMALTGHDQLWLLVIFSAGALLLLIRTHVFEEEITWARRRIGEPGIVGELYLGSGALFVAVAIVGAVLLTWTAASAPLQGAWADVPRMLQGASQWLQKFAPPGGQFRPLGIVGFGEDAVTNGLWQPSKNLAFRASFDPVLQIPEFKWRAGTYAVYKPNGEGWEWGPHEREALVADQRLTVFSPQGDAPETGGRRRIEFQVTPEAFRDPTILGPNLLEQVNRATDAVLVGADGWFAALESADGVGPYRVSALIPVRPDLEGGLSEARLRAAGREYSTDILATYTALPPNAVGPQATDLLAAIKAAVPPGQDRANPYDLARTMESYLRDPNNFTYKEDVREARAQRCGGVSTVECFATIRQGYCEYYASTMTVLLRQERIPARVVYGFLPSTRDSTGLEIVPASGAHWWVEVYFPGIGWFDFDPTGGGRGQPQPLPSGSLAPPTPRPTGALSTVPLPTRRTGDTVLPTPTTGTGIGPFIAIALILLVGVVALGWAAYRRVPTKPMPADKAWGSLARLAGRFGLGPRPSQTVYEYAGALGDAVPTARVEVTTLARAKVEVAYGKRDLGGDQLRRIAEAYHRLRIALIGVVLRRSFRRPRRRR